MAAPAEVTGIRLVDLRLGNGLQEMEIGETVDSSVDAGEPTRRSTCHFAVRIGCGGENYKRVKGRSHPVEKRPNMHPHKPHASSQDAVVTVRTRLTAQDSSYKRVKGRSHTVGKRKAIHPQKPHATSQPSRFSHTPRLSTAEAHN